MFMNIMLKKIFENCIIQLAKHIGIHVYSHFMHVCLQGFYGAAISGSIQYVYGWREFNQNQFNNIYITS